MYRKLYRLRSNASPTSIDRGVEPGVATIGDVEKSLIATRRGDGIHVRSVLRRAPFGEPISYPPSYLWTSMRIALEIPTPNVAFGSSMRYCA